MTIHVACAVDTYIEHSAVMLHSVLAQRCDADVVVHYLHAPGFPADAKRKLVGMVEGEGGAIVFHEIGPARVTGLATPEYFSAANWFRLFLPELVPESDRVLYVDVDAVAADDLRPLFATAFGGAYLAAVDNVSLPWLGDRGAELGLPAGQRYFNSGVLLMNLDAMRADDCASAVLDYGRAEGDRLKWVDQDALNVVLGARRLSLHPRWNAMNAVIGHPSGVETFGAAAVDEARRHPGIRHFEGPGANKPWHYGYSLPHGEIYRRHRKGTPWPRVRLEGVPRRAVLTRLLQGLTVRA